MIDRTKPSEVMLRWVPLASAERPSQYTDVLLWNPCDGAREATWSGEEFYFSNPYSTEIGSATHWAELNGPEPSDDISINWKLWQGTKDESNQP